MAPNHISLSWLEQNLWSKIPEAIFTQTPILLDVRDCLRKTYAEEPKSLPASSLTEGDVRKIFGLENWPLQDLWSSQDLGSLDSDEIKKIPNILSEWLALSRCAFGDPPKGAPLNGARARAILDMILICLLSEEKKQGCQQTSSRTGPAAPQTISSTAPIVFEQDRPTTPKDLSLRFKTELECPVTYNGEQYLLRGVADYSIWYPDGNSRSTNLNLTIVDAKEIGTSETMRGQLLAYMAIIHRARIEQGKQNSTVYGIATDSNLFRFLKIDDGGRVYQSKIMEWEAGEGPLVCSYIRYIIRTAVASSSSTPSLKPDEVKKATLTSFKPDVRGFDFNVSPFDYDTDPSDDDSSEIPPLPSLPLEGTNGIYVRFLK
ncbi:hypothetical protein GP486_004475 [Trichoglossum hirsutum]|uniref:Uncharacterized protein n=1 Tax=Trichoglossum hirsutum TaxID=265104 RepID=A0A9P8LB45_9PEZI|nr:hypothetical protein GP486_004475 [Trichoglossum hirsutum]